MFSRDGTKPVSLSWFLLLILAALVLGLLSCGGGPETDTDLGSTLHRGLSGEPESIDPHRVSSNQALNVLRDMGEGLVGFDAQGEIVAGVSDRWEVSADGLTLTFYFNPEARWSNGEQVSSRDFVFSMQRLVDPDTAAPYSGFLTAVVNAEEIAAGTISPSTLGVTALNDSTLEIRLKAKTPYFLQLLAHPATFPIQLTSFESHGLAYFRPENYLSNGAYKLVEWELGSSITLRRNDDYWAHEDVAYDHVVYHLVDQHAEYRRYVAGELDVTSSVPESYFAEISQSMPNELKVAPYAGIYYYGFNLKKGPFADNLKLRQALSMAIDRKALVNKITARGEREAYSWVPTGVGSFSGEGYSFSSMSNIEREDMARKLFDESGVGDEFAFELRYNTFAGNERIAIAIQNMWLEVLGIRAKLIKEEFRVFIDNVRKAEETEVFWLSWTGDYDDPLTFLQLFESSNSSNLTGYSNEEFDKAIEDSKKETDASARTKLLQGAEQLALSEYPVIPLYFYVSTHLVRGSVGGWEDNVMDIHLSKHLWPTADVDRED